MNKLLVVMQLISAFYRDNNCCFKVMYTTPVFIAYFSQISFNLHNFLRCKQLFFCSEIIK